MWLEILVGLLVLFMIAWIAGPMGEMQIQLHP